MQSTVRSPRRSTSATQAQARAKVPTAVLGTGSIGARHLRVLRDLVGAPVSAVPVRASRRWELEDQRFKVCSTLEEAVAGGARAVVVATDTARHMADLGAALKLGCCVLVEKPLSPMASGLAELARSINGTNQRVYIACDLRFDASLLHFRQRLPEIGKAHSVRIECQSYLPDWRPGRDYRQSYSAREAEGGVLLDLIHEIDYAVWLFGPPSQVFARLANFGRLGIAAEESADLYWQAPGGTAVSIRLDYLTPSTHRNMSVYGEWGEIEWDGVAQSVSLCCRDSMERRDFPEGPDATMRDQDAAFLEAASGGDADTLTTFAEGALAVSICDAARRSSMSGKFEAVVEWRAM